MAADPFENPVAGEPMPTVTALRPRTAGRTATPITWLQAHRIAGIAVQRAHAQLGTDVSGVSIDVIAALGAAQVMVLWRPLPQLFGAYVNEAGSVPGVLLHNGLPRAARRQTAAHELGHHWMKHATSADDGSTIDTVAGEEYDEIPPANRRRAWPDQEKLAEAFATWFLMPRRVVLNALDVLNLDKPATALDMYRLSLLLGTSYRTTVRHMTNLRLASPTQMAAWSKVAPGRIKAGLDAGLPSPASRRPEVWALDSRFGGHRIKVLPGDRLVATDEAHAPAPSSDPDGIDPDLTASVLLPLGRTNGGGFGWEVADVSPGTVVALPVAESTESASQVWVEVGAAPAGMDPRGQQ